MDTIRVIYNGIPKPSAARKLVAQLYTDYGSKPSVLYISDDVPRDFLVDLLRSLLLEWKPPIVRDVTSRDYYDTVHDFNKLLKDFEDLNTRNNEVKKKLESSRKEVYYHKVVAGRGQMELKVAENTYAIRLDRSSET